MANISTAQLGKNNFFRCVVAGYMEYLLTSITDQDNECSSPGKSCIKVITPSNPADRGAQLSLMFPWNIHEFFAELQKRGVVVSILSWIGLCRKQAYFIATNRGYIYIYIKYTENRRTL